MNPVRERFLNWGFKNWEKSNTLKRLEVWRLKMIEIGGLGGEVANKDEESDEVRDCSKYYLFFGLTLISVFLFQLR